MKMMLSKKMDCRITDKVFFSVIIIRFDSNGVTKQAISFHTKSRVLKTDHGLQKIK